EELAAALTARILMINVESRPELHHINQVAGRMRCRASVSLRVNPDLDPGTHPHISTGHRDSKFGVPLAQVHDYYAEARGLPNLERVGLSTHTGPQIPDPAPFNEAAEKVRAIVSGLRSAGVPLKSLALGGGLGFPSQEGPPAPAEYARVLLKPIRD